MYYVHVEGKGDFILLNTYAFWLAAEMIPELQSLIFNVTVLH